MPSCLVNQCISKTGKRGQNGQIILHPFPKDLSRIKIWLQQTGQTFTNLDALAQKIFDENKRNKYRLCSCHFAIDAYVINIHGRTLRVDAVPSIFPIVSEGEYIIQENLRKDRKRKRKRPFNISTNTFQQPVIQPPDPSLNIIVKDEDEFLPDSPIDSPQQPLRQSPTTLLYDRIKVQEETHEDFQFNKIGFCSIGTQTDHTISNSILLFKENEAVGSIGQDGLFTPGFTYKKPKIISKTQKPPDLCHAEDVQSVKVKEEPEEYSDSDMSTRYWRVESSVSGNQQLTLQ